MYWNARVFSATVVRWVECESLYGIQLFESACGAANLFRLAWAPFYVCAKCRCVCMFAVYRMRISRHCWGNEVCSKKRLYIYVYARRSVETARMHTHTHTHTHMMYVSSLHTCPSEIQLTIHSNFHTRNALFLRHIIPYIMLNEHARNVCSGISAHTGYGCAVVHPCSLRVCHVSKAYKHIVQGALVKWLKSFVSESCMVANLNRHANERKRPNGPWISLWSRPNEVCSGSSHPSSHRRLPADWSLRC